MMPGCDKRLNAAVAVAAASAGAAAGPGAAASAGAGADAAERHLLRAKASVCLAVCQALGAAQSWKTWYRLHMT